MEQNNQLALFDIGEREDKTRLPPEPDYDEIFEAIVNFKPFKIPEHWNDCGGDTQYMTGFMNGVRWMIYRNRGRKIPYDPMAVKLGLNYRKFYLRVKHRWPSVERQCNYPSDLKTLGDIPKVYERYCELLNERMNKTDYTDEQVFIAVIAKMEDKNFDEYGLPVHRGTALILSNVLNKERSLISHALQTVKNYMRLYPGFRQEVDYFYRKMIE